MNIIRDGYKYEEEREILGGAKGFTRIGVDVRKSEEENDP